MAFCANLRQSGVFFYVSNRVRFGHLIDADEFSTHHLNNELWEISRNRWDWEQRYIHENYSQSLEENAVMQQPCPDVYWFPIVTERFADELVAEVEHYGKWSDGSNNVRKFEFSRQKLFSFTKETEKKKMTRTKFLKSEKSEKILRIFALKT